MNLLERLIKLTQAVPDRAGRYHCDCPACGAPGTRNGRPLYHFYFYISGGRSGATCWSCGYKQTLVGLLHELGDEGTYTFPVRTDAPPEAAPPWQRAGAWKNWKRTMEPKQEAIWQTWQAYRPFTRETVARAGLAVERLVFHDNERGWYHARHPRLIVPIVREGVLIGLRGRAYRPLDDGPKWLSAAGTQTWLCGIENVRPGSEVIWCESLADRLLGEQQYPGVAFVASGGLTWQDEWLDYLKMLKPRHVLVWFDHDLSGNGSHYHEAEWIERRRSEQIERQRINPKLSLQRTSTYIPDPRGPVLAQALRQRGIRAEVYEWPQGTPEHQDMGAVVMEDMR